ncbi:MAG: hypothetical protein P8Y72_18060 [Anaerolineales bacterium]
MDGFTTHTGLYPSGLLVPGIITQPLVDIVNFSYWWSDVADKFEYQTLAQTGVDLHFVVWLLIFTASIALFCWNPGKIKAVRMQI